MLALLRRQPMHGYELMSELDRLFRPHYRPSPGGVYPALTALVGEGLVAEREVEPSGRRRVYRISPSGRRALSQRRAVIAAFEVRTGVRLGLDDPVADAIERLRTRIMAVAERVEPEVLEEVLDRAAEDIEHAALATRRRHDG